MINHISYKAGYNYVLGKPYKVQTGIVGVGAKLNDCLELKSSGMLLIHKHYAWDGPSGPAVDTKNFMRGALVHDALYQLMREGLLPRSFREQVDALLRKHCREDGMSWLRAWWVYRALRAWGGKAALASSARPYRQAP